MKIEDQVVILEVARELNEKLKGVNVNTTMFSWNKERSRAAEVCINRDMLPDNICFHELNTHRKGKKGQRIFTPYFSGGGWEWDVEFILPTYTLTEMLEMLPADIPNRHNDNVGCEWGTDNNCAWYGRCGRSQFSIEKAGDNHYDLAYTCIEDRGAAVISSNEDTNQNTATAAAKLMIWWITSGHVKGDKS